MDNSGTGAAKYRYSRDENVSGTMGLLFRDYLRQPL